MLFNLLTVFFVAIKNPTLLLGRVLLNLCRYRLESPDASSQNLTVLCGCFIGHCLYGNINCFDFVHHVLHPLNTVCVNVAHIVELFSKKSTVYFKKF